MKVNELVELLRENSKLFEDKYVHLPIELIKIIQGNEVEDSWGEISIEKVMYYLADMFEE